MGTKTYSVMRISNTRKAPRVLVPFREYSLYMRERTIKRMNDLLLAHRTWEAELVVNEWNLRISRLESEAQHG